jgi:hypothetical protein
MFASKDLFFTKSSGGYVIQRSVRLRSSASAYLNRTPGSSSNRTTWTWSGWVKRGTLGGTAGTTPYFFASSSAGTDAAFLACGFNSDQLVITGYATDYLQTNAVYRDPSSWYHIVIAFDSTQATASNRIKFYVNGVQITSFSTANYVTLNFASPVNLNQAHYIGGYNIGSGMVVYYDGYLTEINFIDGQQLTPTSFGAFNATTGVWQPIKYTGTYGTNGFYLNFGNNASTTTLGYDTSGNGNNWTTNNISLTAGSTYDSMTDVPTLTSATVANYAVLNPLDWQNTSFPITNGNLTWTSTTTAGGSSRGTVGMTSGQWYWEITATSVGAGACGVGVAKDNSTYYGSGQALYSSDTGNKYIDGTSTAYGATWATGVVIGVAYDAGAGQITFYKNNASQGTITLSGYAGVNVCPVVADGSSLAFTLDANFGQRPFTYTPPTGYVALNTYNLPTPTIKNGAAYMAATTYTGNGSTISVLNSNNTTTGVSFQPDFVWMKNRSNVADHALYDVLRTAMLSSNTTAAEVAASNVVSYNSNGFTIASGDSRLNANTNTYIGWNWKAGGTGVSNTNGSITSTVSAGATQGFSVVTYSGTGSVATVGHGLGVAPKLIIGKRRNSTGNWQVYHGAISNMSSGFITLNSTNAFSTGSSAVWNNTAPTSSVFTIGTDADLNASGSTNVAYCFSEITGYSKFGSYSGTNTTDGPFVYCGFRPRFIMTKNITSGGTFTYGWAIFDTSRENYNINRSMLQADSSNAEDATINADIDILSNGFKPRYSANQYNGPGTYIFVAFAENPFNYSLAR